MDRNLVYNLNNKGNPAEMRLCLPTLKGFIILKLDDILYCEAERSYTVFHLEDKKTVTVSKPLIEYENILDSTQFSSYSQILSDQPASCKRIPTR